MSGGEWQCFNCKNLILGKKSGFDCDEYDDGIPYFVKTGGKDCPFFNYGDPVESVEDHIGTALKEENYPYL